MKDSVILTNVTNCDMTLNWGFFLNGEFRERNIRLIPRQIQDLNFINDDDKNSFNQSHEIESLIKSNKLLVSSSVSDDAKMTKEQEKMKSKKSEEKQKINEQTKGDLQKAIDMSGAGIKITESRVDD